LEKKALVLLHFGIFFNNRQNVLERSLIHNYETVQILTGKKTKKNSLELIDSWKKGKLGRGLFERGSAGRPSKEGQNTMHN